MQTWTRTTSSRSRPAESRISTTGRQTSCSWCAGHRPICQIHQLVPYPCCYIPRQEQWQREYYLFNEILRIKLFKQYGIWKAFRVWRSFVQKAKVAASSARLEKHLFILNGIFRKSLLKVREACSDFADGENTVRLCALEKGKVYRLDEFVSAQEEQANTVVGVLKDFNAATLASVTEACTTTLTALEHRLFGDEDSTNAEDAVNETGDADSAKVSYTVLAQRRAEHRKLQSFIKLTDYMIRDNLHRLVVDSVEHLLEFVMLPRKMDSLEDMAEALDQEDEGEEDDEEEREEPEEEEEDASDQYEVPLFEIESHDADDTLGFTPGADEVQNETDKLLASFTITVSSVPSLSAEKSLKQYTALVEA